MKDRLHFFFLNIGHFLDHLFTLVFATVAALALANEWGMSYAELIPYATPGFVAFGLFSLPCGWLADRWSREGMIAVFFVGVGLASIVTAFASTPLEIGAGLFVVGMFAAIYHPVGLALVAEQKDKMGMAIAMNGVWGNLGVGSAALATGLMIDLSGWRSAFVVPGLVSVGLGIAYAYFFWDRIKTSNGRSAKAASAATAPAGKSATSEVRALLIRVSLIIFFTAAVSSLVFQGTTFALPRVFEERLNGIATSASLIGWMAFIVFAIASMAQLIVGRLLDRYGPRYVFAVVAVIQIVFFLLMPGLTDWAAMLVALAFMLGAFGQIPINDYMIGKMAKSELRASVYGARYVVSFAVLAATIPLIAYVHHHWGFDMLFYIMAAAAVAILGAVLLLPTRLPEADAMLANSTGEAKPAAA
ncbi:MAG: MFS transporter [Hyphomicrobiales bacterium]|nr:MFS transporter [Hyphomicrobiales bacterium]